MEDEIGAVRITEVAEVTDVGVGSRFESGADCFMSSGSIRDDSFCWVLAAVMIFTIGLISLVMQPLTLALVQLSDSGMIVPVVLTSLLLAKL